MSDIHEHEVVIKGNITIRGTLALPEKTTEACPAILFIHGSGPTDRDENANGLKINAFKELSDALVPSGYAALRYDKRGVGESEGDYISAGFWDLVDDARAALDFLKQDPRIDARRIILLGHSEGCIIAPALNARQAVQGLILLAGIAEPFGEIVARQERRIFREFEETKGVKGLLIRWFGVVKRAQKAQAESMQKLMESQEDVVKMKLQKINAKWLREHFAYNVVDDLAHVTCPVLAITGDKDLQVLPEHAEIIAELVQGDAECHIIKDMNHLLRIQKEPGSLLSLNKIYKESVKQPVDPDLILLIKNWLDRNYK
ncbi:alpha/beta hydrolase family protein [Syntrophomonas curvata]